MKHLFIINPMAGKGKTHEYIPQIHEIFKGHSDNYIIEITNGPGHASKVVREYVSKEDYRVYSIGGDGTLNEIVNGIVNSNSSLGVMPAGTGNDFVRSIYDKITLEKLIFGDERWVDLGRVNDKYFINISSIGIDAEIASNVEKFKNLPFVKGRIAYILAVFTTIYGYRSRSLIIDLESERFVSDTLLLCVANGNFYGGGMKVAPKAILWDALFDVCHIKKINKFKIPFLFPKLIKGVHENIEAVSFYKAKNVKVFCDDLISLNLDGEIIKVKTAEFNIEPKAIKIIIPRE